MHSIHAVQGYLKLAKEGRYEEALALIKKDNPLPAICGRICNRRCRDVSGTGHVRRVKKLRSAQCIAYIHITVTDGEDLVGRINCYDTGTAPCKTACPAHIAVQGYLKLAKEGRY